jgi:hypothetical protein
LVVIAGAIALVVNSGGERPDDLTFLLILGTLFAAIPFGLAYGAAWLIEGFVAPKTPPVRDN